MKILIHSINFSPDLVGIGKYSAEMAEWLVAQGHEVRVVTAPPYYPQWQISDGYANRWHKDRRRQPREKKGLTVYRCPLWVPAEPSGPKRLLHLASFMLSSFPVMLRQIFWRSDVVLVVKPALFCVPQAWLVARLSGAKAWLHIQDFEIDAAFGLGMLPAGGLQRWLLVAERLLIRRFDRVSTISFKMLERLGSKGVESNRTFFFPNWVDLGEIHPLATESEFRDRLGILPNHVVALYSGNMGEKQGLEIVLEAAALLQKDSDIRFVLCGDGTSRLRLQKKYTGLANVVWLPLQPLEVLNELLNLADMHLLPQRGDVADMVMPSKLLGMLASGRPVLTNAHADTQVGGVVSQCGIVSFSDDPHALSVVLTSLASDPDKRKKLGMVGRRIAEKQFSKEVVLRKFEQELKELCHD
ncbi:MAG: glycosyltransferase WbuB [Methylobacter sp.]|uniref:glycosyltransferase WbuB n=1 Tax=Methylobacter sp. TaxID=2051955 RepID=UPI00272F34A2|nr:glycosyltransferase WbuB [Methylobacter sp.]MDP1663597.1 glycosyltransferase WbuB [Methylobacter sp.]